MTNGISVAVAFAVPPRQLPPVLDVGFLVALRRRRDAIFGTEWRRPDGRLHGRVRFAAGTAPLVVRSGHLDETGKMTQTGEGRCPFRVPLGNLLDGWKCC